MNGMWEHSPGARRGRRRGGVGVRRAMTLLELLISIAIIVVLIAMLAAPVLRHMQEVSFDAQCRINLKRIYDVLRANDEAELPPAYAWTRVVRAAYAEPILICPKGVGEATPDDEGVGEVPIDPASGGGSGDGSGANIKAISPPRSGVFNDLEDNTQIFMWVEREAYRLPSPIRCDITRPGYYERGWSSASPGTIPAGKRINSTFLHYDSVGNQNAVTSGSITMGGEILGIIVDSSSLDATDPVLGHAGTRYDTGRRSRGFESGAEKITLEDDMHTLTINRFQVTFPGEEVRIITDAGEWGDGQWGEAGEGGGGGPTSYGINLLFRDTTPKPRHLLLSEYNRSVVDLNGQGSDDDFETMIAPRHFGRVNVLYVDGSVDGVKPEDLDPVEHPELWEPGRQ